MAALRQRVLAKEAAAKPVPHGAVLVTAPVVFQQQFGTHLAAERADTPHGACAAASALVAPVLATIPVAANDRTGCEAGTSACVGVDAIATALCPPSPRYKRRRIVGKRPFAVGVGLLDTTAKRQRMDLHQVDSQGGDADLSCQSGLQLVTPREVEAATAACGLCTPGRWGPSAG